MSYLSFIYMRYFISFILMLLLLSATAQKEDRQLQYKIDTLLKNFHGTAGVFVYHFKNNRYVWHNADSIFPTASIVKIPILIGIMDKIEKGELNYRQELVYKDSLLYEGEDILGSFKQNEKIQLDKVIMLMLTMSDNTASLWLQSLAGGGARINALLEEFGFTHTRVNSRTPGRESNRSQFGWGQTTAREMATLMKRIYQNNLISPAACERMLRCLKRNYWDGEGLGELPPGVNVFSKNGAVNASRSEVMLVNAPHGDYVYAVFTKNNQDQGWGRNAEAFALLRNLSAMIWQHYEYQHPWQPAPGGEKYH